MTVLSWTAKQEAFKKNVCEILVRIDALKFGAFRRVGDVYVELAKNV
jgi:hypothetical protein